MQASVSDVVHNNRLMMDAARGADVPTPLTDASHRLVEHTELLGHGQEDTAAVLRVFEALDGSPRHRP